MAKRRRRITLLPSRGGGASTAESLTFAPSGDLSATNVQDAIEEVATDAAEVVVSGAGYLAANDADYVISHASDPTFSRRWNARRIAMSANLFPDMTSAIAPSGTATESEKYDATFPAWKMLDRDAATMWHSVAHATNSFSINLGYDFGAGNVPDVVAAMSLTIRGDGDPNVANGEAGPGAFTIDGSDDGTTWETLHDAGTGLTWTLGEKKYFGLTPITGRRYYRLHITAAAGLSGGGSDYFVSIIAWEAYGVTSLEQMTLGGYTLNAASGNMVIVRSGDAAGNGHDVRTTFRNRTGAAGLFLCEVRL